MPPAPLPDECAKGDAKNAGHSETRKDDRDHRPSLLRWQRFPGHSHRKCNQDASNHGGDYSGKQKQTIGSGYRRDHIPDNKNADQRKDERALGESAE